MLARDIPHVSEDCKTAYVCMGGVADDQEMTTSSSGKAVRLSKPKHIGEFWCPASLLRRRAPQLSCCAPDLLVPVWFLRKENIQY